MKRLALGVLLLASCVSERRPEQLASSRGALVRSLRPMLEVRGRNACVELGDGRILAIGSDVSSGTFSSTAEAYDPKTDSWTKTGLMTHGSWNHAAIVLPSGSHAGQVLVAGGYEDAKTPPEISNAELFDPKTNTFSDTGSLSFPRYSLALVMPPSGKPIAVGGATTTPAPLMAVEQFDPDTGTWTRLPDLIHERGPAQAVMLDATTILATGAYNDPEYFDGTTWQSTSPSAVGRDGATLTLLPDGRAISIGGKDAGGNMLSSAEIYDPATKKWTLTGAMAHPRSDHAAVRVKSGLVVVGGGELSGEIEAYDWKTSKFSVVGLLATPRQGLCATTFGEGAVFVGGAVAATYNQYVQSAEAWLPDTSTTSDAGPTGDGGLPNGDVAFEAPSSTPTKPHDFQHCNKNGDCSTGHCVEGVCCDTACDQLCFSCALPSSPGKCTAEPVGVDLKGECGSALSCTGTCGPSQTCIGSGAGAQCAKAHCTSSSTGVGPVACTAQGAACPVDQAAPFDCGAFACDPAFGDCLTSCSSSSDCAGGAVCDLGSKTCAVPEPASSSGCGVARSSSGGAGFAVFFVLAALLRARARRLAIASVLIGCSAQKTEPVASSHANLVRTIRPLNEQRGRNACVELPDGRLVVFASDKGGAMYSATTEIYDPATNVWKFTSPMKQGRWNHSAVIIPSGTHKGQVAVVGGFANDVDVLSTVELFDPATGTFTSSGSMATGRKSFALVLPKSGKPVAIAGDNSPVVMTVEQFDPDLGTWSALRSVANSHAPSEGVVLADGASMLVTGNVDLPEYYDGTSWKTTGPQVVARDGATLTLLPDGRVLAAGGYGGGTTMATSTAELYDPNTKTWKATGSMAHPRYDHAAVRVTSGLVIVAGGESTGDVEAYDSKTEKFSVVGYLSNPREGMCATTFGAGAVFIGGAIAGSVNTYTQTVEAWVPGTAGDAGVDAGDVGTSEVGATDAGETTPPVSSGTFSRCVKNADCTTGHCVEGVCCDTACDQKCFSCALPSSPGKCTPEPVGVDLKGECGAALACVNTCGPAQECINSGPGSQCAKSHCTSPSTGVGPATCITRGAACPTDEAVAFDCGAYACEQALGTCLTTCTSSADCAGGYVCDTDAKTCAAPAPTDSGGCTYAPAPSNALPLLTLLALALRRRR